jgi:flagellar biosynthesis protein FliP
MGLRLIIVIILRHVALGGQQTPPISCLFYGISLLSVALTMDNLALMSAIGSGCRPSGDSIMPKINQKLPYMTGVGPEHRERN